MSRFLTNLLVGLGGGLAVTAVVTWVARRTHTRRVLSEARARAELLHEGINTRDSGMIH